MTVRDGTRDAFAKLEVVVALLFAIRDRFLDKCGLQSEPSPKVPP